MIISGIFKRKVQEEELLPPPPPFPILDEKTLSFSYMPMGKNMGKKPEPLPPLEDLPAMPPLGNLEQPSFKDIAFTFFNKTGLVKTEAEKQQIQEEKQRFRDMRDEPWLGGDDEAQSKSGEFTVGDEELDAIEKEISAYDETSTPEARNESYGDAENHDEYGSIESVKKPQEVLDAEQEIQDAIASIQTPSQKEGLLNRIFKKKNEMREMSLPIEMPAAPTENQDPITLIDGQVNQARNALMDFKFDKAKEIYVDIIKAYNELDKKAKYKVYETIKDLYYERKNAEQFAA